MQGVAEDALAQGSERAQSRRTLGTSRSTIAWRIKSEITAVKAGAHYRIPVREFERFRDATLGEMISDVSADLEAGLYGQ